MKFHKKTMMMLLCAAAIFSGLTLSFAAEKAPAKKSDATSESAAANPKVAKTMHVYHVGNSLTRGLTMQLLFDLMASRGIDYQFGAQLAGGVSLLRHWDAIANGGKPPFKIRCWETRNPGPGGKGFVPCGPDWEAKPFPERFGTYDKALKNHKWDAMVLQLYGSSMDGDIKAIQNFIDFAEKNKSVKRYYIYSTWPKWPAKGVMVDGKRKVVLQPMNYSALWEWKGFKPGKGSYECHAGRKQLMEKLRKDNAKLDKPVCIVPVGEVLYELDKKIKAGRLPGLEAAWKRNPKLVPHWDPKTGIKGGVAALYADRIHLNPTPHLKGNVGNYAAAMTMMSTLTGQSPVGLSGKLYGLDDQKDAALIKALQETVWDVVTSNPYTGVKKNSAAKK